ncbi:cellulose synthase operon protein YhjQ/BcsQ [Novosphingobium aerophilum]|uniref:cellulose synthase operon protein YhjQ/BcsQ n=1 Tax=Novosphingobium TaxID=165696 RepID=UPI0006C85641|nr:MULTISPECIES: cellulose synthase operon protein YhjQ/BcsQ [unclassified Novosphingobium]KPH58689.1 ATPase [Novosphingobium sp. ST904]MPS70599.1 ATPase [Novosphingobium sp.]TCM42163.1 cellulose biosynthesis protein BcsQ [Novosphingobium sp. ST904]WRT91432.1 cellulose synthase operon protein YhjQ/BcsQ [Novosphingobium sp. RL4]
MPMIVCHGPKGGAGNTFVAAHLAMGLSAQGAEVTVLTLAPRDSMPLHFGLSPATSLPALTAPADEAVLVGGINLRSWRRASEDLDFVPMLGDLGYLQPGKDRVLVVDVPSGDTRVARRLIEHACAHVCTINAQPDTLAMLPQVFGEAGVEGLARTAFVINALDETRRLGRHGAAFIRELAGPRLIGRIRLDEAVPEAMAMLQPLSRYAPASVALTDAQQIAEAVTPSLESTSRAWIAPAESRAA